MAADQNSDHSAIELARLPRRTLLKALTATPLIATFGLSVSPLMRFLKPTMEPGNLFQASDFPVVAEPVKFALADFTEVWNCIPTLLPMKYVVFSPQKYELRYVPAFVIRVDKTRFVAFARNCPMNRTHILNYVLPVAGKSCGCEDKNCKGLCVHHQETARLVCPCDGSSYSVIDDGHQLCQGQNRRLRALKLKHEGEWLIVDGYESQGIV